MSRALAAVVACLLATQLFSSPSRVRADETVAAIDTATLARDVDALLAQAWARASVTASPDASDGELCRRLYLDLVGRTPGEDEVRSFVADRSPAKVEVLVDRLLASSEHPRHMAEQLTVAILSREWKREGLELEPFRAWLTARLAADTPLDKLVSELLTARGLAKENAATYFVLTADAPADLAGRTARVFLGRRIQCAQCHDHPYEPWRRSDFWAAAAFFQRVKRRAIREPLTPELRKKKQQPKVIDWEVKEDGADETRIPLQPNEAGRPKLALPRFLGSTYDFDLAGVATPRMPALAKELVERERAGLARALANRLFALLFARGAVHPIDDLGDDRAVAVAGLLDRLGRGLAEHAFRMRPFLRSLVLSRAYARSSAATGGVDAGKAEDPALTLFARARHKPLAPEVVFRSLVSATRSDEAAALLDEKGRAAWQKRRVEMQRRLERVASRPEDEDPHAVRESIPGALALLNGPDVHELCAPRKGSQVALALAEKSLDARIDRLALAAFARSPTADERARWTAFLSKAKDPAQGAQDLFWSMLNSTEFLYGH